MKVLEGIKVLDFGRFIAGPFCAALLADYGADVIRIDKVGGSEDRFILPVSEEGEGAQFLQVNRNKRSITLDIGSESGREIVRKLVETADVVVANMPPRVIHSLGLDYETLRSIKPDIILTASSAFGTEPAVRDRTGFDSVAQCSSGFVYLSGLPDHPMKAMAPVIDYGTALSCALGTMMALYERKLSGVGQEVSASLMHTALTISSAALIEEAVLRVDRKATMNRAPHYAPSDLFRTRDGRWIMVQAIGTAMFERWAKLVDRPELLADPRFSDDIKRGDHGEELSAITAAWCSQYTCDEALALLEKARVPGGPVNSPRQVLEDENIRAAKVFRTVEYPGVKVPVPLVGTPVTLSRTPPSIERRPPMSGEHTEEVLQEIGYSPAQISDLRARGVV